MQVTEDAKYILTQDDYDWALPIMKAKKLGIAVPHDVLAVANEILDVDYVDVPIYKDPLMNRYEREDAEYEMKVAIKRGIPKLELNPHYKGGR